MYLTLTASSHILYQGSILQLKQSHLQLFDLAVQHTFLIGMHYTFCETNYHMDTLHTCVCLDKAV